MQRDLFSTIQQWNDRRKRKPLVLMGARQVGKTWLMEEFAQRTYGNDVVSVNFMRKQSLCRALKDTDIDPVGLLKLLQTASGKRIVPGRTLLILDEIQECPSALTSLKFFREDLPELAVMAAGSLLGLSYGGASSGHGERDESKGSFPVGKVDRLNVYPMTFAEFLVATGKSALREAIDAGDWRTVELLKGECEELLKQYFVVGGMPEAVSDWVETGSLAEVRRTQRQILADYDDDFKKHAPVELLPKIRLLWENISSQLAKENKKFVYSAMKPGARAREYEVALQWLDDAGMIRKVYRACPPQLPLSHVTDFNSFKLYVHDVGLLGAMSALDPDVVLEGNELFAHFKGALTEQFVLQEMCAREIERRYWTPDQGVAELDFVVQGKTGVYPVEVKSATNTKAKSLGVYMRAYEPDFAVKTSLKGFCESHAVCSVPLYAFGPWLARKLEASI